MFTAILQTKLHVVQCLTKMDHEINVLTNDSHMCRIVCMYVHNLTVFLINVYKALLEEKMEGALYSEPVNSRVPSV